MDLPLSTTLQIKGPAASYVEAARQVTLDGLGIILTALVSLAGAAYVVLMIGATIELQETPDENPQVVADFSRHSYIFSGLMTIPIVLSGRYILLAGRRFRASRQIKRTAHKELQSAGFEIVGWRSLSLRRRGTLGPLYNPMTGKAIAESIFKD